MPAAAYLMCGQTSTRHNESLFSRFISLFKKKDTLPSLNLVIPNISKRIDNIRTTTLPSEQCPDYFRTPLDESPHSLTNPTQQRIDKLISSISTTNDLDFLSPSEKDFLRDAMLIDEYGRLKIDNLTHDILVNLDNVKIWDSFSFWGWRKVCRWKDNEENTALKVLKSALATPAFLVIGSVGILETVGRAFTSFLVTPIYFLITDEYTPRLASQTRLSSIATAEAITGLVTNCFSQELEERSRTAIAHGVHESLEVVSEGTIISVFPKSYKMKGTS